MDKIDRVKKVVSYVTKMSEKELLSKSRKRHIVDNRRMAFVICRDILELSWTKIAKELIREIVNIKRQRYNNYLKQKLKENEGKGQSQTTFIGPSI